MPVKILKQFMDSNHVKYTSVVHSPAYTAQEVAQSLHMSGRAMAKVVIVELDGDLAMAVLPATRKIVSQDLRDITGCDNVRLASEMEFKSRFPDCEVGAMPPFGNLYGLPVYVDQSLTEDEEIVFHAGTHSDAIRMRDWDFASLVFPVVAEFHRSPSKVW